MKDERKYFCYTCEFNVKGISILGFQKNINCEVCGNILVSKAIGL